MAIKPVSVSQLNTYMKRVLATDPVLSFVKVSGEISSIKYHGTGNVFMTISDSKSKLSCFINASIAEELPFSLEVGEKITLTGGIDVYTPYGTYSLQVREIEKDGVGELVKEFERLKKKLDDEGLFKLEHKKNLPEFPGHIGVITSDTGAAVQDILKVIKNRNNYVNVTIFPVRVQGIHAASELETMVRFVNSEFYNDLDILIIGRGGGAPEDLMAFNDENLARAIYDCRIPVISAVGHEIDFSISDFVADRRAETPTSAAEMAVPDIKVLRNSLDERASYLAEQLNSKIDYAELLSIRQRESLFSALNMRIGEGENQLEKQKIILEENNPLAILSKGYTLISDEEKVISSVGDIEYGKTYRVDMRDGSLYCRFTGKDEEL